MTKINVSLVEEVGGADGGEGMGEREWEEKESEEVRLAIGT